MPCALPRAPRTGAEPSGASGLTGPALGSLDGLPGGQGPAEPAHCHACLPPGWDRARRLLRQRGLRAAVSGAGTAAEADPVRAATPGAAQVSVFGPQCSSGCGCRGRLHLAGGRGGLGAVAGPVPFATSCTAWSVRRSQPVAALAGGDHGITASSLLRSSPKGPEGPRFGLGAPDGGGGGSGGGAGFCQEEGETTLLLAH